MFTAYTSFKHPVQFMGDAPAYMAVELTLNAPWLIAEAAEGDFTRVFLLDGLTELEAVFLVQTPFGPLDRLSLIFPPAWSITVEWRLTKIQQIEQLEGPRGPSSLVLLADDGNRFAGMPIERCHKDLPHGTTLLQLPVGPRE